MTTKWKNRITVALLALFCAAAFFAGVLRTPDAVSQTERRKLAQLPAFSWESVWNGTFFSDLESYVLDQFPLREKLRTVKAVVQFDILRQQDNNGIYIVDGAVYKTEYPTNLASVQNAANKFENLYAEYLSGTACKAYLAVIPDKNYYVASKNGYPSLDYDAIVETVSSATPHLEKIDLFGALDAESYYRTDTHWRQEKLTRVLDKLGNGMGLALPPVTSYAQKAVEPFYGVYYGQSALPLAPDTLTVLESPTISACTVLNYETGKTTGVYAWDKLSGMDAYDVFLSGACPLLVIENGNAASGRELVIFRDSFGSSLAPLLLSAYRRVTLVDIRYMSGSLVGQYVSFSDQDVLFLYSTLLLNNSSTLK